MRKKWGGVRPGKKPGSWIIDYTNHNSQRRQFTFYGTRKEAKQHRADLITHVNQIKRGFIPASGRKEHSYSLSELWKSFYNHRAAKVAAGSMKETSLTRHKVSYKSFVSFRPSYRRYKLTAFREGHFEDFKAHKLKEGYSPWGINSTLVSLRCIFNYAVDQGMLDRSPLKNVKMVLVSNSDVRFLSDDELKGLEEALHNFDLSKRYNRDGRDLVLCYLYTGARSSELLLPDFTWKCVRKSTLHFPRTKWNKDRVIPLVNTVKVILKERKRDIGGAGPFDLSVSQVHHRVKHITASIDGGVGPQVLRKTAGAWFYMATRDIFATAKFLGHSTVVVTERHYAGLIQSLHTDNVMRFSSKLDSMLLPDCK